MCMPQCGIEISGQFCGSSSFLLLHGMWANELVSLVKQVKSNEKQAVFWTGGIASVVHVSCVSMRTNVKHGGTCLSPRGGRRSRRQWVLGGLLISTLVWSLGFRPERNPVAKTKVDASALHEFYALNSGYQATAASTSGC